MEHIEHLTVAGDRWDLLAYRYYGDPARIAPLAEANPHLRLLPSLPGGLVLRVPMPVENETATTPGLPPWKR